MIALKEYINPNVNESVVGSAISMVQIRSMDSEYLLTGILNMYDYICDGDDMKYFYQDFPVKERVFWENLYKLYNKQVWSIFDIGDSDVNELNLEPGEVKITPEIRRNLRKMINSSKNNKLDVKPGQIKTMIFVDDKVNNSKVMLTINKRSLFGRLLRMTDYKLLEKAFEKLSK